MNWKKICKLVILKKFGLSEKFPCEILYTRKSALGVGLIAPRTIIDILALKLYIRNKRADNRVS